MPLTRRVENIKRFGVPPETQPVFAGEGLNEPAREGGGRTGGVTGGSHLARVRVRASLGNWT